MAKAGIVRLFESRLAHRVRRGVFRFEDILASRAQKPEAGFFDSYPRFYSTSVTSPAPNRLNRRHQALIESNREFIQGKSLLDIASHDGRWSFAAHRAGARQVLGIEARNHLVENARATLRDYQVPDDRVRFVVGDVFAELDRLEPGGFDTVLCFGFFYHTLHHMLLLAKIARLTPQHLILDTAIDLDPGPTIVVRNEGVDHESAGAIADAGNPDRVVVGTPTRSAMELMLSSSGFSSIRYYDWPRAGLKNWKDLGDYRQGRRVSLVASLNHATIEPGRR